MFGKNNVQQTVIGEGAQIKGILVINGSIQVDGEIDGDMHVNGHVSIGPEGFVKGEVVGDDIAIGGQVEGKVTARNHLQMIASGRVKGDVFYGSINVERGATIEGKAAPVSETLESKQIDSEENMSASESDMEYSEPEDTQPLKVFG